jgi:hypothetical protein
MLTTQPTDRQADLTRARERLRAARTRSGHGIRFGEMSGTLNGVFIHKHFDHHLRQVGV